jgi:hypothetical protein
MTALFNGPVPAGLGRFDLPQRVLGKATSRLTRPRLRISALCEFQCHHPPIEAPTLRQKPARDNCCAKPIPPRHQARPLHSHTLRSPERAWREQAL